MEISAVSVIIPVYNGEKYIERCLESIINQSYQNLEILIINDNSIDASEDIIKKYLTINTNIRYYKNNTTIGPGLSRNKGLEMATSPYILFLDCDDWIDLNCIQKAMSKFNSDKEIDIVLWEIKTAYYNSKISPRYNYQYNNILNSKMALSLLSHSFSNEYFLSPLLGCKIFKKQLLDNNHITFLNTVYEDDMFTFLSFLYSKKIGLITGSNLYYYQNAESITHHFADKNIIDFFTTFKFLYNYIDNSHKEIYYKYLSKCLSSMIECMVNSTNDIKLQNHFKALIFCSFYEQINIEEYYSYTFSLTI